MSAVELSKIMDALKEVSEKQDDYKKLYLASKRQNSAVELCTGSVDAQGKFLDEVSEMISIIKGTVESISEKVQQNEKKIDDLEQYSRSNCLILHGCCNSPKGNNNAFEDYVVNFLNNKLKLPAPISHSDIDICHELPSKKGKNPIIIKFVRRTVRNLVFNHKRDLKSENGPKYAITESLTKRRLKIMEEARKMFNFKNVWSLKGDIYCCFKERKHRINTFEDIGKISALSK